MLPGRSCETGRSVKKTITSTTCQVLFPTCPAMSSQSTAPVRRGPIGIGLPVIYRVFFLLIEPISAAVGAYYAHFRPLDYLRLTHAESAPTSNSDIPLSTTIVLSQLANLYFFFALNEAVVLRSTADLRVWKAVLFCLLVGDLGHLYTVRQLGIGIYYGVFTWNAIDWGNIPFVYAGALMRVAFLLGIGLPKTGKAVSKKN